MNIFITGTNSFVGKELIKKFDALDYNIIGCDITPPEDSRFFQLDIRSNKLIDLVPEKVDGIVHLASLSTDGLCKNNEYNCFDINVMGTLNIMNAARKKNAKQFIFASSEWVYENIVSEIYLEENFPINPNLIKSEYALSKLVSEINLKQKYNNGFCDVTILRFGIIYGPRQSGSAIEHIFSKIIDKKIFSISSLETGRCFVYIDDIIDGIVSAIGLKNFQIINIAGNKLYTLGEIIEATQEILGYNNEVKISDPEYIDVRKVSINKAKDILKWEPKININMGITKLYEYHKDLKTQ